MNTVNRKNNSKKNIEHILEISWQNLRDTLDISQLDFLILDEPTTHLDENRRKELVTVLENLRRVPQLIIVDHHPELLEAADTRFLVSLTPNGLLIGFPAETNRKVA